VSCTTRPPRDGEVDGLDYHFLSRAQFEADVEAGHFLEHAEVHGNLYGTLLTEVLGFINAGKDVVMDIDVQGAAQVRSCTDSAVRTALVDLFVMPPGEEELLARLSGRGTDAEDVIALRMKNALEEMAHWREYQYCLLSGDREDDYARFMALLAAERLRVSRLTL
jgi:guanylate kinase